MRASALLLAVLFAMPVVSAGTRDDPELRDPANDVTRWPGIPTVDPSSDFISVWFHEDEQNLYLAMEVVQHITYDPEVTNVLSTSDHLIGAHVNGEGQQTSCSGWGAFNVRDHYSGQAGRRASLRIYWPMDQQTEGCNGDDYDVEVTVEDNVATFTVPWHLLAGYIKAGDELTVSDARAGSGSTWPATPNDYADNAPGRAYEVEFGSPPVNNGTSDPQTDGVNETSDAQTNDVDNTAEKTTNETPSALVVTIGALAAVLFIHRRDEQR